MHKEVVVMAGVRVVVSERSTRLDRRRTGRGVRGQGMVEYALTLLLVAVAAILVLQITGHSIFNVFAHVNDCLNTAGGSSNGTSTSTSSCTTGGG